MGMPGILSNLIQIAYRFVFSRFGVGSYEHHEIIRIEKVGHRLSLAAPFWFHNISWKISIDKPLKSPLRKDRVIVSQ